MTAQIIAFPRVHRERLLDAADILTSVYGPAQPCSELDALIAALERAIESRCPQTMGLVADRVASWDASKRA